MIVTPELVLAWAVRQLFAAKDIRDAYNERKGVLFSVMAVVQLPDLVVVGVKEWTMRHGHLLAMGGYTLVSDLQGTGRLREPRKPGWLATAEDWENYYEQERDYQRRQLGPLTVDRFKELLQDPNFEFPDITEADIQDRSKGDMLFKFIAIAQTTWFIIQCGVRSRQQLALTELELVTLALASLNGATFFIWWCKPLGVQEPLRIYLKTEAPRTEVPGQVSSAVEPLFNFDFVRVFFFKHWEYVKRSPIILLQSVEGNRYRLPMVCYRFFASIPFVLAYIIISPLFIFACLVLKFIGRIVNRSLETVPPQVSQGRSLLATRFLLLLYWLRRILSMYLALYLFGRDSSGLEYPMFDHYEGLLVAYWLHMVPLTLLNFTMFSVVFIPFYILVFLASFIFTTVFGIVTTSSIRPGALHVPSFYAPSTKSDRWSRMAAFAFFGILFGGLHCIGWHYTFPSHSEQTLWRSTSLAITVIPLIVAPIDFLLANRLQNRDLNSYRLVERISLLFLDFIMTILLFVYVPTRLFLIAQGLALLRNQPPTAFVAGDWTKFTPHLFS